LLRKLKTAGRFLVVFYHVFPLILTYARDRNRYIFFGSKREVTSEKQKQRAEKLLEKFLILGPSFIKLGQILSTRADALPREYTQTLSKLQDEVPPSDWEKTKTVIEEDVGEIGRKFDDFRTEAIKGASLGQVYIAKANGRTLAVKVLRPGVRSTVESDIRVMNALLPTVKRFVDDNQSRTLQNLVRQYEDSIRKEMDYNLEADMMRRIRRNFEDDPDVVIPEVVERLSGRRVISMEYVESRKINDVEALEAKDVDKPKLVREIQRTYAKMILDDGLFHADPHPGNLGVDEEENLVFYDFGVVGKISEQTRESLFDFYDSIGDEDTERMAEIFVELDLLPPDFDKGATEEMFGIMVDDLKGRSIEETSAQNLITDIQDDMYGFPVRVTREFALLFRAISLLEGVCHSLDEEFDFTYEAYIYVLRGEYGNIADAMEMVPDPVRERVSTENLWLAFSED